MDTSIDYLPSSTIGNDGQHLTYFIERETLRQDLKLRGDDFCYQMIKTFLKAAQTCEKDISIADPDALGPLKIRKDDLVICSLGILAHLNWDVERISKGVHSTRFRSLLHQLVVFTFPEKVEFILATDYDFFTPLFEQDFDSLTENTIFASWICARWLLFINKTSHFPIVLAKQTVSNPWALVDTSLVSADSHGKTVQAASNYTMLAVQFMEKLCSSTKLENMKIPTAECFLKRNPMNEENFTIWEADLKPEFELSDVVVPTKFIKWKTMYELLLANFSNRHIRTSRKLCQKLVEDSPNFSTLPENVEPFVSFDVSEIALYAASLGLAPPASSEVPSKFYQTVVGSDNLASSFGFASRTLVKNEETKRKSMAKFEQQMRTSSGVDVFNARSLTHLLQNLEMADEPSEPDEPGPTDAEFENFHLSGPPFFSYFATIDGRRLPNVFNESPITEYFFPDRLTMPQELAQWTSHNVPKSLHSKLFLILGKFKQLSNLRQPEKLSGMADLFVQITAIPRDSVPCILFLFEISLSHVLTSLADATLISLDVLQREHAARMINIMGLFQSIPQTPKPVAYRHYLQEFLNLNCLKECSAALVSGDDIISMFYVGLVNLMKNPDPRIREDFNRRYLSILNLILPENASRFTLNDFIEHVEYISNAEALKIILNSTIIFYNFTIRFNDQLFLIPGSQQQACYMYPESFFNLREQERTLLKNYSDRLTILLRAILRQANRFLSTDTYILRVTGDFLFTQANYSMAIYFYTNCILSSFNHLSFPLNCYKTGIDDLFWKKFITCLIHFKRPTEAAVTTTLVNQMFEILPHIPKVIEGTKDSYDAVADCFPFIGDIAVYEGLSGSYAKVPQFRRLHDKIQSSVLSKAFYTGGMKQQHIHQGLCRKHKWIRVLCAHIFDLIDA